MTVPSTQMMPVVGPQPAPMVRSMSAHSSATDLKYMVTVPPEPIISARPMMRSFSTVINDTNVTRAASPPPIRASSPPPPAIVAVTGSRVVTSGQMQAPAATAFSAPPQPNPYGSVTRSQAPMVVQMDTPPDSPVGAPRDSFTSRARSQSPVARTLPAASVARSPSSVAMTLPPASAARSPSPVAMTMPPASAARSPSPVARSLPRVSAARSPSPVARSLPAATAISAPPQPNPYATVTTSQVPTFSAVPTQTVPVTAPLDFALPSVGVPTPSVESAIANPFGTVSNSPTAVAATGQTQAPAPMGRDWAEEIVRSPTEVVSSSRMMSSQVLPSFGLDPVPTSPAMPTSPGQSQPSYDLAGESAY